MGFIEKLQPQLGAAAPAPELLNHRVRCRESGGGGVQWDSLFLQVIVLAGSSPLEDCRQYLQTGASVACDPGLHPTEMRAMSPNRQTQERSEWLYCS